MSSINNNTFSFEGFDLVNIKTGEFTPVDKYGKPIVKPENESE
jgi:hypothetical protein